MDAIEKQEILNALNTLQRFVENVETQINCNTCIYWHDDKCKLANATPPHHVIDNGCESWVVFDEVPF